MNPLRPKSSISHHQAGMSEVGTLQKRWMRLRLLGQVQAAQRMRGGSRYHRLSNGARVTSRLRVRQAMKDLKKKKKKRKRDREGKKGAGGKPETVTHTLKERDSRKGNKTVSFSV